MEGGFVVLRILWIDVAEEDLRRIRENEWREIIHDRERWRDVVLATKTLREL